MINIEVEKLWQDGSWVGPVWIQLDENGRIQALHQSQPEGMKPKLSLGYVVPGFVNAHSHAFQYLIAGQAEKIAPGSSDFWGWRQSMYQALAKLDAKSLRQVASTVYSQMLMHGYTHVVEFHYLHKDPNGLSYSNPALLSEALIDAAEDAGIGLTLVPVYYRHGDFDQQAKPGQQRFYFSHLDEYRQLVQGLVQNLSPKRQLLIGSGLHSLRAATQDEAIELLSDPPVSGPVHLHISEQTKEVIDCQNYWGLRPVAWLLKNVDLQSHHHLVHATHLNDQEYLCLSASPASVVICPSTEANLGDGFFRFSEYWSAGGQWTIGSDSQVGLCPFEELRWLDYGTRLLSQRRFSYGESIQGELGSLLCNMAWKQGRLAAGLDASYWGPGNSFDAIELDDQHPALALHPSNTWLSCLVYSAQQALVRKVLHAGQIRFDKSR